MQRDMWVGIAWAGGLVVAMVSVFFYGLITYEPMAFDVAWTDTEHEEVIEADGQLTQDASEDHDVLVPGANLTRVVFRLDWTDDVEPSNDEFQIAVSGPYEIEPASDLSGTVEVAYDVPARPDATQVEGANAEHALEQIERPADPWQGDAEWTVTVTLVSAPGSSGTGGLNLDPQEDGANGYTLTVVWVTTDATLTERS